jgi:protein TIF31
MGLKTVQLLDVKGLHVLATCIVNYKGYRIICQSIIPGILNNNELSNLAEYGIVDEKKSIKKSEEFHELLLKVYKSLNIESNTVEDGEGSKVEIAGSTEVKGIKGTDKRNYLVDLQGMTPRDPNYLGNEYHTCLFRPELLMLHQKSKNIEMGQEKIKLL